MTKWLHFVRIIGVGGFVLFLSTSVGAEVWVKLSDTNPDLEPFYKDFETHEEALEYTKTYNKAYDYVGGNASILPGGQTPDSANDLNTLERQESRVAQQLRRDVDAEIEEINKAVDENRSVTTKPFDFEKTFGQIKKQQERQSAIRERIDAVLTKDGYRPGLVRLRENQRKKRAADKLVESATKQKRGYTVFKANYSGPLGVYGTYATKREAQNAVKRILDRAGRKQVHTAITDPSSTVIQTITITNGRLRTSGLGVRARVGSKLKK